MKYATLPVVLLCSQQVGAFVPRTTSFRRSTVSKSQVSMATVTDQNGNLFKIKERYTGRGDLVSMLEEDDSSLASGDASDAASYELFAEVDAEEIDPPKVGEIITGTVIEIDDNGALLEIGGKMSGYLPIKEASLLDLKKVTEAGVEVGMDITGECVGTLRGMPVISLRYGLLEKAWAQVLEVRAADAEFETTILDVNRGGAVCTAFGLKAFLPGSHFVGTPDASVIGKTYKVKFLDVIEDEGKVVVSQRLALNDGAGAPDIKRGEVVTGVITGLRNYGAFLELESGMSGLLHISQISYDRVADLENLFTVGQSCKVMILDYDKMTGRVALSTKTLEPSPGDMLRDMNAVFEKADETAKRYHERMDAERAAREAAAQDIVAGLGSAIDAEDAAGSSSSSSSKSPSAEVDAQAAAAGAGSAGGAVGGDGSAENLVSVAESIENILASIVQDTPASGAAAREQ